MLRGTERMTLVNIKTSTITEKGQIVIPKNLRRLRKLN